MSNHWRELPDYPDHSRTHRINPLIVVSDPHYRFLRVSTVVRWREPNPFDQEPGIVAEQIFGDGPPDDLIIRSELERWSRGAELSEYLGPKVRPGNPNFIGTDVPNAAATLILKRAYRSVRNVLNEADVWKSSLVNMIERGDLLHSEVLPEPSPLQFAELHNLAVWEWRTANQQELNRTLQSLGALRIYGSLAPPSEALVREIRTIATTTLRDDYSIS